MDSLKDSLKQKVCAEQEAQRERRRARHEVEGMARCHADEDRRSFRPGLRALYLAYALVRAQPYLRAERHAATVPNVAIIAEHAGVSEVDVSTWLQAPAEEPVAALEESVACTASV